MATKSDIHISILPEEMLVSVFSQALSREDLVRISRINKQWHNIVVNYPQLWERALYNEKKEAYKEAFGKVHWMKCSGIAVTDKDSIEDINSLPDDILKILHSPCPIHAGQKVKDTHMLVRIPNDLTINKIGDIAKAHFPKSGTGFRYIWDRIVETLGDKPLAESRWVLMTKDVLPGSRNQSYANQQAIVSGFAGYEVPSMLEAVACIMAQYFKDSQTRLFSDAPLTYTRCKENLDGWQFAVGGFALSGLRVRNSLDIDYIGVAARRLF